MQKSSPFLGLIVGILILGIAIAAAKNFILDKKPESEISSTTPDYLAPSSSKEYSGLNLSLNALEKSSSATSSKTEPSTQKKSQALAESTLVQPSAGLWSAIISPSRAVDWSNAGVVGGIPSKNWPNCLTTECNTLYSGMVTADSVEAALASAKPNTVVRIPAGTFALETGFNHSFSNVVLRGAGADKTKLIVKENISSSFGGLGLPRVVNLMSGAQGGGRGGAKTADWTGGFEKGATKITLSNTDGIVAGPVGIGSLLMLDQLNDSEDGWPAKGDIYVCEEANPCTNQGGNNYARVGRAQVQVVTVTNVNGNQVTISPGLAVPNWRTSQKPGAFWNPGSPLHNAGIEDLSVDFTDTGGSGIFIKDAANVWLKGTRWIKTNPGTSETYHVAVTQSSHLDITSNYIYTRPYDGGSFPTANYPYTDQEVSEVVFENNIIHGDSAGLVPNDPSTANVYAYNLFEGGKLATAGIQLHSGAIMMDLFEGNNMESFFADIIHGPHYFNTLFRNHFDGDQRNASENLGMAIGLTSHNRFFNLIGNVAAAESYHGYEELLSLTSPWTPIFSLGWEGNASGGNLEPDPNVPRTTMRWGNWDSVTKEAHFDPIEVPSKISSFSNTVPSSKILPASFYLKSKPLWWSTRWGTPKWPAIGPDVTLGNADKISEGHADKIPARLCMENLAADPDYPQSNPRVKLFSSANCYSY